MKASTNLASRPFRNERLPWLLVSVLALVAVAITAVHARFLSQILSGDEARIVGLVRDDEARVAELESALAAEPPLKVGSVERIRLRDYKELVDRRVFPWRRLLSDLEEALPGEVRLVRIAPAEGKAGKAMTVEMAGEARSKEAAFGFAETLGASKVFSNAVLLSLADEGAVTQFQLEVSYTPPSTPTPSPGPRPQASTAPAAAPSGGGER